MKARLTVHVPPCFLAYVSFPWIMNKHPHLMHCMYFELSFKRQCGIAVLSSDFGGTGPEFKSQHYHCLAA